MGLPGIAVPPGKAHCPTNQDHKLQLMSVARGKFKEDNSRWNAFAAFGRAREGQTTAQQVVLLKLLPCRTHEL